MKTRCPQCWKLRAEGAFIGARGAPVRWCSICRKKYGNWSSKTPAERARVTAQRVGVPDEGGLTAKLYLRSGNRKLGGIPCSITNRSTCPPSCSFKNSGCFAEYHVLASHWRRVGRMGAEGSWFDFCAAVEALPADALWRHNVAGDLPGRGGRISEQQLAMLVRANRGRRGFTFTHYPVLGVRHRENRLLVRRANGAGLTVNLSADSLEEADRLAELDVAPVTVVLPSETSARSLTTPAGRRVTVCPAETPAGLTCATCRLCALPWRSTIVGFVAHGQSRALVDQIVRPKRGAQP